MLDYRSSSGAIFAWRQAAGAPAAPDPTTAAPRRGWRLLGRRRQVMAWRMPAASGSGTITLVAAACAQAATSSAGAITQVHLLAAADSAQAAACTTGAISLGDAINLVAANAEQAAACTTGAISQVHVLQAAACAQAAASAAATISQIHILVAANSSAGASSSTGAIVLGDLPADVWPLQRRRARASNVSAARRAPQLSTATRSNIQ